MVKVIGYKLVSRIFMSALFVVMVNINSSCQSNKSPKIDSYNKITESFSLNKSGKTIIVDKGERKMILFKDGKKLSAFKVTIGEEPGNKRRSGDNRTPEGIFVVGKIENSKNWYYYPDNDTSEPVLGAYGDWFIRLIVPGFQGIGIHGHYHDNDLGNRASKGCIRLSNNKLQEVVDFAEVGTPVLIIPGKKDVEANTEELKAVINHR
ncbi:MAG: L,D-transpeptidase [Chlorobi bacterium]|nr:L,D-transpeptidase [Chlorobiota bacterium]